MVFTPIIHIITWITTHLPTRRDGRLSWPGWLTHSGRFSQEVVTSQPYIGKVNQPKTDVLTTEPRRPPVRATQLHMYELRHVLVNTGRMFASLHVVTVDEIIDALLDCSTVGPEARRQLRHHLTNEFVVFQLFLGLHDAHDGSLGEETPLVLNALLRLIEFALFDRPQRNVDVDTSLLVPVVLRKQCRFS